MQTKTKFNNIPELVCIAVVMVVLCVGIVIPITNATQQSVGDPIYFANSGVQTGGQGKYNEITPDTNIVYEVSADGILINGEPFTYTSGATWGAVFIGENGEFEIRIETYIGQLVQYGETSSEVLAQIPAPYTATLQGSIITVGDYTLDLGTGYYLDKSGEYILAVGLTERTGTWYVNDISDVTVYGVYTTGENDTKYSFVNGVVSTTEEYTSKANYTLTKVDGTTDVYQLTDFTIDIGGEEFNPYNSIIVKDCYGHKTTGVTYTLFGIIPIILLIAPLMAIIAVFTRRE